MDMGKTKRANDVVVFVDSPATVDEPLGDTPVEHPKQVGCKVYRDPSSHRGGDSDGKQAARRNGGGSEAQTQARDHSSRHAASPSTKKRAILITFNFNYIPWLPPQTKSVLENPVSPPPDGAFTPIDPTVLTMGAYVFDLSLSMQGANRSISKTTRQTTQ